jgi:outer membrane protein assembly factor BamB
MKPINTTCPWSGKPVSPNAMTQHGGHVVGFCSTEHRDQFVKAISHFAQSASPAVTTRSFDLARTSANVKETILTPNAVRSRGIKRLFSLNLPGDARGCEAQPLIVPGLVMADGSTHDVVFLATMANQVWAFDANDGAQLWQRTLGRPIDGNKDIDWSGGPTMPLINDHWGILSTPVIDLAAGVLYTCAWIGEDGRWQNGQHSLHALHLRDGTPAQTPLSLEGTSYQPGHGLPAQQFRSMERKQRAALTLTQGAVIIPFGTIQESSQTARGWLIVVDTKSWTIAATWCSTARGSGGGIWHSGAGPAVDSDGFIYVVTGNGDFDGVTDFGESIVKLKYTSPASGRAGTFAVVDWWTPWTDDGRVGGNPEGEGSKAMQKAMPSNFRMGPHLVRMGMMESMGMASGVWSDQDFGSGGPVLPPIGGTLLAAGKDGILYTANTQKLGATKPSDLDPSKVVQNYAHLKAPPIFYTYYPGAAPASAPANVQTLNLYFAQRTHHLHGTPVAWQSATQGLMHFCGGENGNLRAWRLNADGTSTYLACSAEVASPQSPPPGGMPGWMISLSANGRDDGIVWALVPAGDGNMELTPGRLLAYDAANFGVYEDGSKQLVVLWDSWDWGAGCAFTHPKFNRPIAWNGKLFVPTYDGRVDVYGLA